MVLMHIRDGGCEELLWITWERLMRLQGLSSKLQGLCCSLAFWSSEQFADTELAGSVLWLSIGSTDKQGCYYINIQYLLPVARGGCHVWACCVHEASPLLACRLGGSAADCS